MKDLKDRTKKFALDVVRFCSALPKKQELLVIGKQLIKSSTSVGANYRSACRAKSNKDFVAKLSIVEEEANQLVSIIVTSKKTVRKKLND